MYNPQPLSQERIDQVFADAQEQADYVIGLYRLAYPSLWERIKHVQGFPEVSKMTNEYIFTKAIEFDRKHHPQVFAGGCWLNNGFRSEDHRRDWMIYPCDVELEV